MKRSTRLAIILLPLVVGVAGFWLGRTTERSAGDHVRLVQLEQENGELKATLEKLRSSSSTATLQDQPGNPQVPRAGPSRSPLKRDPQYIDDTETVRALRENLASANRSVIEWQSRAAQLQTQLDQLRDDQKRLAAIESDLTEQLASSKRLVETKEAELSRNNEQLVSIEAANKKLRADAVTAGQKASQLLQVTDELQEVYRRRETYLNTLTGRYREVTEQYRAFASVLENRRGPEGTSGAGISIAGPELARIQNSIAMAEEDLRQLNTLNAQALRIQKKLSVK